MGLIDVAIVAAAAAVVLVLVRHRRAIRALRPHRPVAWIVGGMVVAARAFEPFFTEHGMANSTGLGLSMASITIGDAARPDGGRRAIERNQLLTEFDVRLIDCAIARRYHPMTLQCLAH